MQPNTTAPPPASDVLTRLAELTEAQAKTQAQVDDLKKSFKELSEATDKRIASLVSVIRKLIEKEFKHA